MKTLCRIAATFVVALALVTATAASATPTQCMPDQAKKNFAVGAFQVMASACTGSGAPSPCCTGAGAGATCPTYKFAIITNAATAGTSTTTWASISANEASGTGYSAGGATLTGMSIAISSNHAQWSFTSPLQWTTSTITGRAGVLYCSANCPSLDVVAIFCLDGGSCAADVSSTAGTYSITLPAGVVAIN